MKIAVMTDVHANLPALEAALGAIERERCEAIYHIGDAIGIGPYPAECLDLMLGTPAMRLLMGNHDAWFAYGLPEPRPSWMDEGEVTHQRWVHAQLDPAWRAVVARWPYVVEEEFHGLRVAFVHYGLDESGCDYVPIIPNPSPQQLDRLFGQHEVALVFYGHHHPASDLSGQARYVNPGSVGCHTEPLARFAVLEITSSETYTLKLRAVPYDTTGLWREFERRQVPERDFIRKAFFRFQH